MLKPVGQHAKRKSLCLSGSFVGRLSVSQDTGQFDHFRQPAAIFLSLILDG